MIVGIAKEINLSMKDHKKHTKKLKSFRKCKAFTFLSSVCFYQKMAQI